MLKKLIYALLLAIALFAAGAESCDDTSEFLAKHKPCMNFEGSNNWCLK